MDGFIGTWEGFENVSSNPVRKHNRRFSAKHFRIRGGLLSDVQKLVRREMGLQPRSRRAPIRLGGVVEVVKECLGYIPEMSRK